MENLPNAIILFDGTCNFCSKVVQFVIKHDKKAYFSFAPLHADIAKKLLEDYQISVSSQDSVVLIENGKIYLRSNASMHIAKHLDRFWKLGYYFLKITPLFIRDYFYKIIAKNRYKWFGENNECFLPDSAIRDRFLE